MSEIPTSNKSSEDEIDLRQLISELIGLFRKIGVAVVKLIINFRNVTKKYGLLLIALTILFMVLGILASQVIKPTFVTTVTLRCDYLSHQSVKSDIEKMNLLSSEKSNAELSTLLGIDDKLANHVISFAVNPHMDEEDLVKLSLLQEQLKKLNEASLTDSDIDKLVQEVVNGNATTFEIELRLVNKDSYEDIQNAIIDYFKNKPYISKRITYRDQELKNQIKVYEEELDKLDSLKYAMIKGYEDTDDGKSESVIVGEKGANDAVEVYRESMAIQDMLIHIKQEFNLKSYFEVVNTHMYYDNLLSNDPVRRGAQGALFGLGFGYLLVLLMLLNNYFNKKAVEYGI